MESLIRFFDGYNRTARLYPGLLTLAPLVLTVVLLKPDLISTDVVQAVVSAVVLFGGTYFLASFARSRGKTLERKLLERWGGWPTTILLRHSDDTIESQTKARYHRLLEGLTGNPMPTKAEELLAFKSCDDRYRAATTQLVEVTRGAKHKLVHTENASYGFRRNLLGLKPVGIVVCFSAMLVAVVAWQIGVHGHDGVSLALAGWKHAVPANLLAAFVLDLMFSFLWISVVTEGFVRQAANEYALSLFRALDEGAAALPNAIHSSAPTSSSDAKMRSMLLSFLRHSRASTGQQNPARRVARSRNPIPRI